MLLCTWWALIYLKWAGLSLLLPLAFSSSLSVSLSLSVTLCLSDSVSVFCVVCISFLPILVSLISLFFSFSPCLCFDLFWSSSSPDFPAYLRISPVGRRPRFIYVCLSLLGSGDTSVNRIYRNSYFHGAYSLVRRQIINHKNNRYLHSMLEGGKYLGKNEVRKRDWGRQ